MKYTKPVLWSAQISEVAQIYTIKKIVVKLIRKKLGPAFAVKDIICITASVFQRGRARPLIIPEDLGPGVLGEPVQLLAAMGRKPEYELVTEMGHVCQMLYIKKSIPVIWVPAVSIKIISIEFSDHKPAFQNQHKINR